MDVDLALRVCAEDRLFVDWDGDSVIPQVGDIYLECVIETDYTGEDRLRQEALVEYVGEFEFFLMTEPITSFKRHQVRCVETNYDDSVRGIEGHFLVLQHRTNNMSYKVRLTNGEVIEVPFDETCPANLMEGGLAAVMRKIQDSEAFRNAKQHDSSVRVKTIVLPTGGEVKPEREAA